jgi:tetratricopeptide (TPR) repeat protein
VAHELEGSPAEQELLKSVNAGKLIRAREQAEAILRQHPGSILGRYGLTVVFHDEEGNLPRALYHARLAERELASRYGGGSSDGQVQLWHRRLLEEQEEILGEMDRRDEQLAVMDRWDTLYKPNMDRRRIWPLMKLHRFDEAVRLARRVSLSEDMQVRISGLNGLLAIESERLRPRECFKVAMEGIEATGYQSCILLENGAEAAFAVFRFGEVERLALRSLQAGIKDCPASAYPHLANLYLLRGDYQRAMSAVKSAREHGIARRYRQQFEMGNQTWLARLLYALGQFEKSLEKSEQVVRAPDRVGMTSFSSELMRVIALVEHHAALAAREQELLEQASARPIKAQLGFWLKRRALEANAWLLRRRAGRLLAREDTLVHLVRPYFKPLPPWNAGALVDAAGSGVLRRAIAEARRRETMPRETVPYFEALEAEIALREGELARGLAGVEAVLRTLPRDEALLRGRLEALAADAARRLGRAGDAERLYHGALERFPSALRFLGLKLPIEVRSDEGALSRRVARALLASPRLSPGGSFTVRVTGTERELRICLQGRGGRRYGCAEVDLRGVKKEDEQVARAVDAFHTKVFAPKIDLTQRDINSLDGSAVRGEADEVLKQILGQ